MQSNYAGPISRSSSTALSIAQQLAAIFDDMSIAQGLLNEPKDPRHRSSFTGMSFVGLDGSDNQPQRSDGPVDSQPEGRSRRAMRTSNTWTSSSGDVLSDQDDVDDRTVFVQEYNRLARKHGIRQLNPEDFESNDDLINPSAKPGSWFSRKILRKTSSTQSVKLKPERHLKHRRSISDISLRLKAKRDKLKDKDLQELVRLCGSSLLYLPTEYAAGSLAVPTCFRATAQFLVQHAPSTRGVFRVPGSQNVVAALYNHYGSMDEDGQVVSGTVRCPTLPDHIRCDVHDVASAFKRFLSGLPGGILGSLQLLNAFISIQTQLRGDPELTRTKQSKVRARLIALAIATLRSQYRRELVCAVFGLLSMIGRGAEIAPREDDRGRPLLTSDLMGYGPLGIIFGPLLVGNLLEDYTMRIANPQGGLVLLPISPPKSRKEKHKKNKAGDEGTAFNTHVDKIKVANSITEMLITHWRDVVRHMKNLSALKIVVTTKSVAVRGPRQPMLRPSASESFALRKPPDWDHFKSPMRRLERSVSPTPTRRTTGPFDRQNENSWTPLHGDMLVVKKQRSKSRPMSMRLSGSRSMSILSPTVEEKTKNDEPGPDAQKRYIPATSNILVSGDASSSSPPSISKLAKEATYSPSTTSDDGSSPLGMISLPGPRDDPDLDLMRKENQHPRSTLQTSIQESLKLSETVDQHNKQPLHIMSIPTFPTSSPGRSSHKKGRLSNESSNSIEKVRFATKGEVHKKLHKISPTSIEKERSRHEKNSELPHQGLIIQVSKLSSHEAAPATLKAESSDFIHRRKVRSHVKHENKNSNSHDGQRSEHQKNSKAIPEKASTAKSSSVPLNQKLAERGQGNSKTIVQNATDLNLEIAALPGGSVVAADDLNRLSVQGPSSLPFKHLAEKDSPFTVPSPPNPEITISRTSSRISEETDPKSPRRIGGSEPGLQPRARSHSPRRVSRSLYESPRRIKNLLSTTKLTRDPLSRVSREEDDASLAILAQAMNIHDTYDFLDNQRAIASDNQEIMNRLQSKEKGLEHLEDAEQDIEKLESELTAIMQAKTNAKQQREEWYLRAVKGWGEEKPLESLSGKLDEEKVREETAAEYHHQQKLQTSSGIRVSPSDLLPSKTNPPRKDGMPGLPMQIPGPEPVCQIPASIESDSFGEMTALESPSNSPGSPSKISALVARFNTGVRQPIPSIAPSSAQSSPAKSPMKTPTKVTIAETKTGIESPKNSIVALYTTNPPPSPTRSQKSEKTPQSARTGAGESRSILDPKSSPVRKQTPKRILRESLQDSTPLRSVPKVHRKTSTVSPTKGPSPYTISLRSVQKSVDGSPTRRSPKPAPANHDFDGITLGDSKASSHPGIPNSAMTLPAPRFEIKSLVKKEQHSTESSITSTGTVLAVWGSFEDGMTGSVEQPSSESKHVYLKPATASYPKELPSDFLVFDGPGGAANIGRILPRPDPLPVAQHLQLHRPGVGTSPEIGYPEVGEANFGAASMTQSPPPGRSSSLLYNQVRMLQRQLSAKDVEITHLKKQLNARDHLDVGTLSEELRESKRDLQSWKTRAEVAEKQLEIVMKIPSRSNSLKHAPSRRSDRLHRSSNDFKTEERAMVERIKKALHGMDGNESHQIWSSEDSTDTVIRDLEGVVVTGSEYSNWAEHMVNTIDAAEPAERSIR